MGRAHRIGAPERSAGGEAVVRDDVCPGGVRLLGLAGGRLNGLGHAGAPLLHDLAAISAILRQLLVCAAHEGRAPRGSCRRHDDPFQVGMQLLMPGDQRPHFVRVARETLAHE